MSIYKRITTPLTLDLKEARDRFDYRQKSKSRRWYWLNDRMPISPFGHDARYERKTSESTYRVVFKVVDRPLSGPQTEREYPYEWSSMIGYETDVYPMTFEDLDLTQIQKYMDFIRVHFRIGPAREDMSVIGLSIISVLEKKEPFSKKEKTLLLMLPRLHLYLPEFELASDILDGGNGMIRHVSGVRYLYLLAPNPKGMPPLSDIGKKAKYPYCCRHRDYPPISDCQICYSRGYDDVKRELETP